MDPRDMARSPVTEANPQQVVYKSHNVEELHAN